MRKLVDQAPIPKDAISTRSDDGARHTYQAKRSDGHVTDRDSMTLIAMPKTKPGGTTESVESVAPKEFKK